MSLNVSGHLASSGVIPHSVRKRAEHFVGRSTALQKVVAWLDTETPLLCLTGDPGTGKSALMAWLAGCGPASSNSADALLRSRVISGIAAAHFCVATRSGADASLDPWQFAQSLARQFAGRYPSYGTALSGLMPHVHVSMVAGSVHTQIGPQFGSVNLGDAASLFHTVCQALGGLRPEEHRGDVILLVDALDEAALWQSSPTILDLVASSADGAISPGLRVLVTSRPDPDVIDSLPAGSKWDLVRDSPCDETDVLTYVRERIAQRAPSAGSHLAETVARASGGNFLYAEQALDFWLPRLDEGESLEDLHLPPGLDAIYAMFLQREYGTKEGRIRWQEVSRPLLGTVGVAEERLVAPALRWLLEIDEDQAQDALRACGQYLEGERPAGPVGIYHQSFRNFLFDSRLNQHFPVSGRDAHRRIALRYLHHYGADWRSIPDPYGLRYAGTHLAEAAMAAAQPDRHELATLLVIMVLDSSFQGAHDEVVDDPAALVRLIERAVAVLASDDTPSAIPLAIECALGLVAARRERFQPLKCFELAARGEVSAATRRLDLFPVDDLWRDAALLAVAWHAAQANPLEARSLLESVRPRVGHIPLLELMAARIAAELGMEPTPIIALVPPPPEYMARGIVDRLGGTNLEISPSVLYGQLTGQEILATISHLRGEIVSGIDYAPVLAADQEGPLLVSFAAHNPDPGDRLLLEYISLQASNNYVHYRNRSLMSILWAALNHPSELWVRGVLPHLMSGAFAGSKLDFEESLPLALLAVRAISEADARSRFETEVAAAISAAKSLRWGSDYEGDSWGAHKRRLGGLAEGLTLALARTDEADSLLDLAVTLPFGFAGFQAPACLTLAESMRICRPGDDAGSTAALDQARRAAHNVQEPLLCARATSRIRFAERDWWPLRGRLQDIARAFAARPTSREFCSIHVVGEKYEFRVHGDNTVPLPPSMREARTLTEIAQVYERPPEEVARLNPEFSPRSALTDGTALRIADPEAGPLFAARIAAEACADPLLSHRVRVRIAQEMIPLAAAYPTALDSVLRRLALIAKEDIAPTMDRIEVAVRRYRPTGSLLDHGQGPVYRGLIVRD